MSREELALLSPTLAVLVSVLFVNYFIPIKGRLDHSLATTLSAGVVLGVWELILLTHAIVIIVDVVFLMIVVFIADFISTFISFTNRLRNAIATTIVFAPLHLVAVVGAIILLGGIPPR
jgi:hypothetical protein